MESVECVDQILKYLDSKLMFNLEEFYQFILSMEQKSIMEDEGKQKMVDEPVVQATSENYSNPVPYLVRIKTNELIPILHKEFMVGKSVNCDYQILDNKKVSRKHAIFRISNGECYVRDNASTNHTFINEVNKYPGLGEVAQRIEGLIAGVGIHAGREVHRLQTALEGHGLDFVEHLVLHAACHYEGYESYKDILYLIHSSSRLQVSSGCC